MTPETRNELRQIATKHGLTLEKATLHRDAVWAGMQGPGPAHLLPIRRAWEALPGTYTYYDACCAMVRALAE